MAVFRWRHFAGEIILDVVADEKPKAARFTCRLLSFVPKLMSGRSSPSAASRAPRAERTLCS